MRHFLRVDGEVAVGPSTGAVIGVKTGQTLHLDETDPVEGQVADDISRASSGWVEVDEAGAALSSEVDRAVPEYRRHRFAQASAEVSQIESEETGEVADENQALEA